MGDAARQHVRLVRAAWKALNANPFYSFGSCFAFDPMPAKESAPAFDVSRS